MQYAKLLEPIAVGSILLPNRVMMSPMFSNSATPDGFVTDQTIGHYKARASSNLGLLMVEHTSVNSFYLHPGNRLLISDNEYIAGLSKLAGAIKAAGSPVGLQIAHSIHARGKTPADLSSDEISEVINDFVAGAIRAQKAGFDVIEIHLAHTYTLADFVSRRTNRRRDEYGAGLEGRFRIIREIIRRIRAVLGREYPLFARFSADEFIIGGNSLRQTRYYARQMEALGIDCLDVSCGVRFDDDGLRGYSDLRGKPTIQMNDGANVHLAEDIKKHVSIPVITVGKLGDPNYAEAVLREGRADMIALARQLIADPHWLIKVRAGNPGAIHYCRYCNNCLYKRRLPHDPVVCLDTRECSNCLTCLRVCPHDVPFINDKGALEFDNDFCEQCNLCKGICPVRLVRFEQWPAENITGQIEDVLLEAQQGSIKELVITCRGEPLQEFVNRWTATRPEQAGLVQVSCLAALEALHCLQAFEGGASAVQVVGCDAASRHKCSTLGGTAWVEKTLLRARELLNPLGIPGSALTYKAGPPA